MATDLTLLSNLEHAIELLASSRDLTEVRQVRDMAEAARLYAIAIARGLEAQNHAAEIKIRAERRAGELLAEMPKQGPGEYQRLQPATAAPSYDDLGIEKTQAHRWQRMAGLPEARFEEHLEQVKAAGKELSSAGVYDLARHAEPRPMSEPGTASPIPLLRFCQELSTATIVTLILRIAFPDAETAVDATYGSGNFWNGTAHVQVTAHDLDPSRALHGVADFRDLPYDDDARDVVLLDAPHLSDASEGSIMAERFGTAAGDDLEQLIRDGVREAWRVARLGVVIKVTDHIHGQRYVPESDWVRDALGWLVPYEVVYQVRSDALIDPKWGEQLSAYNNGSTFLIFRKDGPLHKRRAV